MSITINRCCVKQSKKDKVSVYVVVQVKLFFGKLVMTKQRVGLNETSHPILPVAPIGFWE